MQNAATTATNPARSHGLVRSLCSTRQAYIGLGFNVCLSAHEPEVARAGVAGLAIALAWLAAAVGGGRPPPTGANRLSFVITTVFSHITPKNGGDHRRPGSGPALSQARVRPQVPGGAPAGAPEGGGDTAGPGRRAARQPRQHHQ